MTNNDLLIPMIEKINAHERRLAEMESRERAIGNMLKSVYDANNNGIVDAAESVPWAGTAEGRPSVFTPAITWLTTPLTSSSWNANPRGSEGPTKIDLSVVFGVPAGVKAVYVRSVCRDSAPWGTANLVFFLGPSSTYYYMYGNVCYGGDRNAWDQGWVACDANGDVYYSTLASGPGTMDVTLQIWGYHF